MKSKMLLSVIASTLVCGNFVRADDDLISIFENTSGVVENSQQSSRHAQAIKKMILKEQGPEVVGLSAEQNIFMGFYDQKDYRKALYQWSSAFEGSSFAKSNNGLAFYALLLFENGMELSGTERLLEIGNPATLDAEIINEWKKRLPLSKPIWAQVTPKTWKTEWTQIFGIDIAMKVKANDLFTSAQTAELKAMLTEAQPGTPEFDTLLWQEIVLDSSLDAPKAAQLLARLMKEKSNPISVNMMTITAARLLYQSGYLDAAIKYYEKVDNKNDFWFEAQEEMAWAYIRKGEPQNSLAILKSITNNNFASWAGPEALFLRSIAELKVCDYPAVVASLKQFREVFQPRNRNLNKVASTDGVSELNKIVEIFKNKTRAQIKDLTTIADWVPRLTLRDRHFRFLVGREIAYDNESKIASKLYFASLAEGTAKVGFQASLDQMRISVDQSAQSVRAARNERLRMIAQAEISEITTMLRKMQIVEAELISQTSLVNKVADAAGAAKVMKGNTGSKDSNALIFAGNQELWFDEIGNYRVEVKGACGTATK